MHTHCKRALARTVVTLTSLPLPAKAAALLITLSVIVHTLDYPTVAGGLATGAALLLLNTAIDRTLAGSNDHE